MGEIQFSQLFNYIKVKENLLFHCKQTLYVSSLNCTSQNDNGFDLYKQFIDFCFVLFCFWQSLFITSGPIFSALSFSQACIVFKANSG